MINARWWKRPTSQGVRIDELAARAGRSAMALYKSLHRIRIALMNCTQQVLAQEELT